MTAPAQPTLPERMEITQPARRVDRGRIALACFLPNEEFGDQVVFSNCAPALAAEIAKRYNAHAALVDCLEQMILTMSEWMHGATEPEILVDARSLLAEIRGAR